MTLRDHLCAAHTLAWQQQRHNDEIALLRAIGKVDGRPIPRRRGRDRRTDDEKDNDENGIYF